MKLTTKELRIGNLIQLNEDDSIWEVTDIHNHGVGVKNENGEEEYIGIDEFRGIELNTEWLTKLGFEFEDRGEDVFDQIWSKDDFEIWEHSEGYCHNDIDTEVYNTHRLQNIHYIFKNEELEIQK